MDRLYQNYVSDHAGREQADSLKLVLKRDLLPAIPSLSARCLDLGCGQGGLSRFLREQGITEAYGVDISPEQVQQAHALGRDYVSLGTASGLLGSDQAWDVITAFDFFEHLEPEEVLPTLEGVRSALCAGGVLVARVPNAAAPLSGRIQYGDFTHKSVFTARSLQQLANAAGFEHLTFREAPPLVHGGKSAIRRSIWSAYAATVRLALAAESGQLRGHLVTSNIMAYMKP